jgi:hypothetical protein
MIKPISPLRQRMIDDMTMRNLSPSTPRDSKGESAAAWRATSVATLPPSHHARGGDYVTVRTGTL